MKFRNIIVTIAAVHLVLVAGVYSCTRKKVDYLGPEYLSAPGDFVATNYTVTPTVDFTSGVCNVTATFSSRVTYYLTFTGLTSGAVKSFTGVDNKIDASSVGYSWNGSHDGIYFFRTGETVEVKLTFLRSTYELTATTSIATARDFTGPNVKLVTNGNFASGGLAGFPSQFDINASLSKIYFSGAERTPLTGTDTSGVTKSVEGTYWYRHKSENDAGGFFSGGIQHRYGASYLMPTWTDPSQIYVTLYVYGKNDPNSFISIQLKEDDKIANGTFDDAQEDSWEGDIPLNFTGWRKVTMKYSDLVISTSAANGGSGNKIKEPEKVTWAQIAIISRPAFSKVEATFDYFVVSYGAPFDPSK